MHPYALACYGRVLVQLHPLPARKRAGAVKHKDRMLAAPHSCGMGGQAPRPRVVHL